MPRLRTAGTGPSTGASNRHGRTSSRNGPSNRTETVGASDRLPDVNGNDSRPKTKRRTLSNFFGLGDDSGERRDTLQDDDTPVARLSKRHSMLSLFGGRNDANDEATTSGPLSAGPVLRTSQSVNFESVQQSSQPSVLRKMKSKLNLRETGSAFINRLSRRPSLASMLPQQSRSDNTADVDDDSSSTSTVKGISPSQPLPVTESTLRAEAPGPYPSLMHNNHSYLVQRPVAANNQSARSVGHVKVDSKNTNDINTRQAPSHKRNAHLSENGIDLDDPPSRGSIVVAGAQEDQNHVVTRPQILNDQDVEDSSKTTQGDPQHEQAEVGLDDDIGLAHAAPPTRNDSTPATFSGTRYEDMPQGDDRFSVRSQDTVRANPQAFVLNAFGRSGPVQQEEGWVPPLERRPTLGNLSERLGDFSFTRSGARRPTEDAISPTAGGNEARKNSLWPFGRGKQRHETTEATDNTTRRLDFDLDGQILHEDASDLIREKSWRSRVHDGMTAPDVDHQSTDDETVDAATRDSNRQAAYAALNGNGELPGPDRGRSVRMQSNTLRRSASGNGAAAPLTTTAQEGESQDTSHKANAQQSVVGQNASALSSKEFAELEDTSEDAINQALIRNYEKLQAEQPHVHVNQFQCLLTNRALIEFRASTIRSIVTKLRAELSRLAREEAELQRHIVQKHYSLKTKLLHAAPRQALAVYEELELQPAACLVDWATAYCEARFERSMIGANQDWDLKLGRYLENGHQEREVSRKASRLTLNLTAIEEQEDGSDTKTIRQSSRPHSRTSNDGSVYATMMQRQEAKEASEEVVTSVTEAEGDNNIVDVSMIDRPRGCRRHLWN